MRTRRLIAAFAAVLTLAGCAGIPSSGEVLSGEGRSVVVDSLVPVAPVPGDSDDPITLTDNFIQACAAGVSSTFAPAQAYLTTDAQRTWDPEVKVTVFGSGDFTPVWDEIASTVTYSLPVIATVDGSGVFTAADPGVPQDIVFAMSQDATGRWRISGIESGIVLAEAHFDALYRSVPLVFASMDSQFFVPELRWFPRRSVATFAAAALLAGPSPWLADGVKTGIPVTAGLSLPAVPITDGIAAVTLDSEAGGTSTERLLARLQFEQTLAGLPDVSSITMTIGGLLVEDDGSLTLADAPIPQSTAVAFVDGRLGAWSPDGLTVVPSKVGALPEGAISPALGYDATTVAFLIGSSELVVTDALGRGTVPLVSSTAPAEGVMEVETLYSGVNLVAPSFDWYGLVWTAERDGDGSLIAVAPDGQVLTVAAAWLQGREVAAVRVSHDGARVAVLSRDGAVWRLDVAALIRGDDGIPRSVGEPLSVGLGVGPASHLGWVDDVSLAVLADGSEGSTPSLAVSVVGGGTTVLSAAADAVELAARNGTSSIAVVTREGEIFQRSTAGWSRVPVEGFVEGLAFSG
jgi:hypothetical protein